MSYEDKKLEFIFPAYDPADPDGSRQAFDDYYRKQKALIDADLKRELAAIYGNSGKPDTEPTASPQDDDRADPFKSLGNVKDADKDSKSPFWQWTGTAALVSTVVATTGIGWYVSQPEKTTDELNRLDPTSAALYLNALLSEVTEDVGQGYGTDAEDLKDLAKIINSATSITPPVSTAFKSVLNDAQAASYLDNVTADNAEYGEFKDLDDNELASVSGPLRGTILAAAQTDWFATQVSLLSSGATELSDVSELRDQLNESNVSDKNKVLIQAAIDAYLAEDIAITINGDTYKLETEDISGQIDQITDATLKSAVQASYNTAIASYIASQYPYFYMDKDTAVTLSQKISDPAVRQVVDQLLAIDPIIADASAQETMQQISSRLNTDASSSRTALDALTTSSSGALSTINAVTKAQTEVERQYDADNASLETTLGQLVASRNVLAVGPVATELPPITIAPESIINLESVKGSVRVPDLSDLGESGTNFDYVHAPTFNEFASITVQNGEVTLNFHANDKLTLATQAQIRAVVEHVRPLLEAAYLSGELNSVRFVTAEEYDPNYRSDTRDITMILPDDDSMSVDQLSSGLTHETIHALVRNIYHGDATKAEQDLIVKTCTTIKQATYTEFENTVVNAKSSLAELQKQVKPEHAIIVQELLRSSTAQTLGIAASKNLNDYGNVYANNCEAGNEVLSDAFDFIKTEHNITDDLTYINNLPAFKTFAKQWGDISAYGLLYQQLNEANFVNTQSSDKEYLGHSEDNANELTASLVDAMFNYTQPLHDVIAVMDPTDKGATVQAVNAFSILLTTAHPELKVIIDRAHQATVKGL